MWDGIRRKQDLENTMRERERENTGGNKNDQPMEEEAEEP